jgi:hypothetical protein
MNKPKISFGMIVFNAESILPDGMLYACIENIYDLAHEILISEGAVKPHGGNPGDVTWASKDGRSTDNTIQVIKNFPDPENKIKLYTKEGYWNGKLEMCNAYLEGMTGDYLWQIDSDEFYHKEDMERIIDILSIQQFDVIEFYLKHFFGDFHHCCDETQKGLANHIPYPRVFRHEPGAKWLSHAPPIYSTGRKKVLNRDITFSMGIIFYHYWMVCKSQIDFKHVYYKSGGVNWKAKWEEWHKDNSIEIYAGDRCTPFVGNHPEIIKRLIKVLGV